MQSSFAMSSDYKRTLLNSLDLFKGVQPDDIHELLQTCGRRDLAEGELLLSPGAKNDCVFVVLSGRLNIHLGSQDTPTLSTMDVGACVGEMSIIEDRDPSAFVIGAEASHLLVADTVPDVSEFQIFGYTFALGIELGKFIHGDSKALF